MTTTHPCRECGAPTRKRFFCAPCVRTREERGRRLRAAVTPAAPPAPKSTALAGGLFELIGIVAVIAIIGVTFRGCMSDDNPVECQGVSQADYSRCVDEMTR